MIPGLNDVMSPDMQKIALFMVPLLTGIFVLVMNLSRGFSTVGMVVLFICAVLAIYFAPGFWSLF